MILSWELDKPNVWEYNWAFLFLGEIKKRNLDLQVEGL
jgi:hypothetical protein